MDCMDCDIEITGKRLQAIETHGLEHRCLDCQELAHKEGRARGPKVNPTALLMRSEPDDNKRMREEGWPEKQILPDLKAKLEETAA